jgi:hypothetical protein
MLTTPSVGLRTRLDILHMRIITRPLNLVFRPSNSLPSSSNIQATVCLHRDTPVIHRNTTEEYPLAGPLPVRMGVTTQAMLNPDILRLRMGCRRVLLAPILVLPTAPHRILKFRKRLKLPKRPKHPLHLPHLIHLHR